ncbi:MAG: hypothetical protein NVS2B11_16970 [Acetobacteraceae bacterium]
MAMDMKRMRGRNHLGGGSGGGGGGGGPVRHQSGNVPLNRNHVFDSNGPDLRVRGTAQQLFEKYLQLGRDATSSGDRVMAESYFQHAEHYFRILNAMNQAAQANTQGNGAQGGTQGGGQQQYGGRRQQYEPQGEQPQSNEQRGQEGRSERDDGTDRDDDEQPDGGGEGREAREIPIAAAPPEA